MPLVCTVVVDEMFTTVGFTAAATSAVASLIRVRRLTASWDIRVSVAYPLLKMFRLNEMTDR